MLASGPSHPCNQPPLLLTHTVHVAGGKIVDVTFDTTISGPKVSCGTCFAQAGSIACFDSCCTLHTGACFASLSAVFQACDLLTSLVV